MANTPHHDDMPKSDQSKKPANRPGPPSGSSTAKSQPQSGDKSRDPVERGDKSPSNAKRGEVR